MADSDQPMLHELICLRLDSELYLCQTSNCSLLVDFHSHTDYCFFLLWKMVNELSEQPIFITGLKGRNGLMINEVLSDWDMCTE